MYLHYLFISNLFRVFV